MPRLRKLLPSWPLLLLLALYFLFFCRYTILTSSDLGRHLANGREILAHGQVFARNYYSYTFPDYPAINHHWLFGVLAYGVLASLGFAGLTLIHAVLATSAVGLVLLHAYRRQGMAPTLISGLLALPLIVSRSEVRPETVSLFFVSLWYVILHTNWLKKIPLPKLLLLAAAIQLVWVNTHVFFPLAFLIIGASWLQSGLRDRRLVWLMLACGAVSVLNPAGLRGALQPVLMFKEYGYQVAENQSPWFMLNRVGTPIYAYILGYVSICILSGFLVRWRQSKERANLALVLSFGAGALMMVRLSSFFGLLMIPLATPLLSDLISNLRKQWTRVSSSHLALGLLSPLIFTLLVVAVRSQLFLPNIALIGLGLAPGTNDAVDFIKAQAIRGPIFNNYDSGGYLIYHLFPEDRVFVDNRPEAYPAQFFTQTYVPMQESDEIWKQEVTKHQFNVIFFYRHDATPWGQAFLIRRLNDPDWAPIYVDDYALILVRVSADNQPLIDRFRIPNERFGIRSN